MAGNEMTVLIEASAGRQTLMSEVQGPFPPDGVQVPGEGGLEEGVTETEVLTRAGLRSSICEQRGGERRTN